MRNRFIKLTTKHFTQEGLELHKYDEDAAKKHIEWLHTWVDVTRIERFTPITSEPENTLVELSNGEYFTTQGRLDDVFERVMKFADNNL